MEQSMLVVGIYSKIKFTLKLRNLTVTRAGFKLVDNCWTLDKSKASLSAGRLELTTLGGNLVKLC